MSEDLNLNKETRYDFSFTGNGREYFKIWIVNILLTIITLYIYSAWAKVRTKRYFAGNTVLDNSSFDYHATGKQILFGRFIALIVFAFFTIAGLISPIASIVGFFVLALFLPWALLQSIKFNMRVTSYRNVRFGFDGKVGPMYLYVLIVPLIPVLLAAAIALVFFFTGRDLKDEALLGGLLIFAVFAFYLLFPWSHKRLAHYLLNNYRYGTSKFSGKLSTGRFYAIYLKALCLSIGIYVAAIAVFVGLYFLIAETGIINLPSESANFSAEQLTTQGGVIFFVAVGFVYLSMFVFGSLITSYFRARLRGHLFNGSKIGERVSLESTVGARGLWGLTIGNICILIFTLGLGFAWVKVRNARFYANHTAVFSSDSLDNFVSGEKSKTGALAEELGDAFDLDIGIGL